MALFSKKVSSPNKNCVGFLKNQRSLRMITDTNQLLSKLELS